MRRGRHRVRKQERGSIGSQRFIARQGNRDPGIWGHTRDIDAKPNAWRRRGNGETGEDGNQGRERGGTRMRVCGGAGTEVPRSNAETGGLGRKYREM